MTNITHENFIAIYDGFFSNNFCKSLITYFEWCTRHNKTYKRPQPSHQIDDTSVNLDPTSTEELNFTYDHLAGYLEEFNRVFWNNCYTDYSSTYSVLADYDKHTISCYKIQKTIPGKGYHVWHCEASSISLSRRMIAYTLYLNDVPEGGETEFLYYPKRVTPKQGRLLLFPTNYPWAHRGNQPIKGTKYIMTGWIELV